MTRIRTKVRDAAFQFRMGAGFPGEVNRTHPASISPALNDATNPVLAPGMACIATTSNTVRQLAAGDTALTDIYGVAVRAYPFQVAAASNYGSQAFGAAALVANQMIDVLELGYILVQVPAGSTATKGAAVYLWCAASTGAHVQGAFEVGASGGNTAALSNRWSFNGPCDATGIVEVRKI